MAKELRDLSVEFIFWSPLSAQAGLTRFDADELQIVGAGGLVVSREAVAADQPDAATAGQVGPKPDVTRDAAELQKILECDVVRSTSHHHVIITRF